MTEPGQRLYEALVTHRGHLPWAPLGVADKAHYATAEAALLRPYEAALDLLLQGRRASAIKAARAILSTTEGKGHD